MLLVYLVPVGSSPINLGAYILFLGTTTPEVFDSPRIRFLAPPICLARGHRWNTDYRFTDYSTTVNLYTSFQ